MSTTKRKKKDKAADYAALAALGIVRVDATYDGCDDSGCIDTVTAYGAAGQIIDILPETNVSIRVRDTVWDEDAKTYQTRFAERRVSVRDAIVHWCYELLEDHFPGWEIDSGSSGTIDIDVKKRRGQLEHEARYTDTTSYTRSFA